jgi:hypothetical protein
MKTIVAGSREINDYSLIVKGINDSKFEITELVSGGPRGVDYLGEKWANANGIKITRFYPDWNKYGKAAGPIRNGEMAKYADVLIAFHRNNSRGTANMIKQANEQGLMVYIINIT